ncbi:hypothetical protein GS496_17180 [Rhodococcus hoagii]|nr:hypothetical protein [Prescottella equi]
MTINLDKLEQLKAAVCDADTATEWINALNNAVPDLIAELRTARATIERVWAITDEHGEPWDGDAFNLWSDIRTALDGARD